MAAAAASVLLLRIDAFEQRGVADQLRTGAMLDRALDAALARLEPDRRIVLESPGFAAIAVIGDPAAAFRAAEAAHDLSAQETLPLSLALDHGLLKRDARDSGVARLAGGALTTAMAVAALALPGTMLATRAFRERLHATDPAAARRLRDAGTKTDGEFRAHEVLARDPQAGADIARRRWVRAIGVAAALVAGGVAVRLIRQRMAEQSRPAIVNLDITPSGDVYLDGAYKGSAPALTRLELPPGTYQLEVRNGRFKPQVFALQLQPGEETQVRAVFAAPARKAEKSLVERLKFWK
ncbi:MAG TPA: PEGA domain-containing protein [Usitatibacteraceae bacterium]|nr:PEGA domain-containing protein [Usitatibacteraceae bacterium]